MIVIYGHGSRVYRVKGIEEEVYEMTNRFLIGFNGVYSIFNTHLFN